MRIFVVGNGGREHALIWKIRQSPMVKEVYCAPGNAGIAALAHCVPIEASNIIEVADFAHTIKADLTIVGPELPIVLGIADEFRRRNLRIFAPSRKAGEIEGSKVFAREFMERHQIPAPRYRVCGSEEEVQAFFDDVPWGYPVVVKADGLAGGKGTSVAKNEAEARSAAADMTKESRFGKAGAKLVMEEFLPGEEVSFFVLSDGSKVVFLNAVQDHKRLLDGDEGPNTGGMGCISPATNMTLDTHKTIMKEIVIPTIKGMASEGRRFEGVLYVGLMMTPDGPKVLEYNARFGDPETQVIMARMRSDIVPLLQGVADGELKETRIDWAKEPAVCVVLAAKGYPASVEVGQEVAGLDVLKSEKAVIAYHSATRAEEGKVITCGGRVIGVTALGANHAAAVKRAYEGVEKVSFEGMHYRKDIGQQALARLQARS